MEIMINYHIPRSTEEFNVNTAALLSDARAQYERLHSEYGSVLHVPARPVLQKYDLLSATVEQVSAPASLFSNVAPDSSMREAAEKAEQAAQQFLTELSLDKKLYELFARLDISECTPIEVRLHEKIIRDFKRSGVDKDEATQKKISDLQKDLIEIGQTFEKNIREDVRAIKLHSVDELSGLPADYIASHPVNASGEIMITTDYPDFHPFMVYAHSVKAREELFLQFNTRAYPQNELVLRSLLEKRFELAQLLGYSSWAAYVTEEKMIKTPEAVAKFIDHIDGIALAGGDKEYQILLEEKRRDQPAAVSVETWEKAYWEERVKTRQYNFDSQSVRPYFVYERIRDGLLDLTSHLFNITYTKIDVPVWHESVVAYDVFREGAPIGRIYLDMHPRDNKYKHAAQFTLRSGIAGKQLPEGVLVCNFTDPAINSPALMDHNQVTTFFHEFGHLLHHVIGGNQEYIHFSGVATEWDFVEAPSQFFEEWAWDVEVLQRFAHHSETGEPIPTELVKRMRDADEFGKALFARRQMVFAATSLYLYNEDPKNFDVHERVVAMHQRYGQFPHMDGVYYEYSFGHLDGYSAIYYTYMWSLVIAKDLLSKFLEVGMLNQEAALQYRTTILEPGGTKDAADLVRDFLGRPYSFESFEQWLSR